MAADMARMADDRRTMGRLVTVLDEELGDQAAPCGRARQDLRQWQRCGPHCLGFIEPGLAQVLTPQALDAALRDCRADLYQAAAQTLRMAGVAPNHVGSVIAAGGYNLMGFVAEEALRLYPAAQLLRSEAFTAVVNGLALAFTR